jgi:hypothetical protein
MDPDSAYTYGDPHAVQPPINLVPFPGRNRQERERVTGRTAKLPDEESVVLDNVPQSGLIRNGIGQQVFPSREREADPPDGAREVQEKNIPDIPPKFHREIPLRAMQLPQRSHDGAQVPQ